MVRTLRPLDDVDPVRDPSRLRALRGLGLLDSPAEPPFDRLARLAARVARCPVALISLVDSDRQFFKSQVGLPEPWASRRQTPLSHSFCRQVVQSGAPLVVPDARLDPLFRENRAVAEWNVVAYLGMPLTTREGHVLGSLCVIDGQPRRWTDEDQDVLRDLAASVMTEIALREEIRSRAEVELSLRASRLRVAAQLRVERRLNVMLEHQGAALAEANARLSEAASTDVLTGLKNRRHFAESLPAACALARRGGTHLSILLIDVDNFKSFNDSFGHPAGDEVLRAVARILGREIRGSDLLARYGGEEFVVLLPETDAQGARIAAERWRRAIESQPWPQRPITASFGLSSLDEDDAEPRELVERADRALYHSKRSGRNRVTHHEDLDADDSVEPPGSLGW